MGKRLGGVGRDGVVVRVNGSERRVEALLETPLLRVLRDQLGLTGSKYGCGEGRCGACTVLLDGRAEFSCQVLLGELGAREVTTIEGLAEPGQLHPVQAAFVAEEALQCGFCAPGMVMGTVALLAGDPNPDEASIRNALDPHICRCGTYSRIVRAVRRASQMTEVAHGAQPAAITDFPSEGFPFDLIPAMERPYFDRLPEGMVAVLAPDGDEPGMAGWRDGGAFVHVGETGAVTASIGKVDGGQDIRTALGQLVAEELRVELGDVALIMGETDISPFDVGTFGSRSMPDAGHDLRLAAAAARVGLVELAAEELSLPADQLIAEQGEVRAEDRTRRVRYGDLVRGLKTVRRASRDQPLRDPGDWTIAGSKAPRTTSWLAVTGAKRFPSDLSLPGMLHGRVLARPFRGAELIDADLKAAAAVPGVQVLVEGELVGVVAEDASSLAPALSALRPMWSPPPQVGLHTLESHLRTHLIKGEGWERAQIEETGQPEEALAASADRLVTTYTTAYIAHVPMEPRAALASWSGDRVTVWTGAQRPFAVRRELSDALRIPESSVRVVVPDFGGGFGGKHTGEVAIQAAILSRRAGRPVRVGWSRAEEFTQGYLRPATVIDVTSGLGRGGAISSWEFTNLNSGTAALRPPYYMPNQKLIYQPAASPLRQGSYRALAATANNFARESHIDELAALAGSDPLTFRLRHLNDPRLAEVLRRVAEAAGRGAHPSQAGQGWGIAAGLEKDGRIATAVMVEVDGSGQLAVRRVVTGYDCGPVVSPGNLVNQIEGATVMGLGGALFEAIEFEQGQIRNASLGSYRVPRFSDVPPSEVILVDRRDQPPAGAGETPIIAVAPALANAIAAAVGVRLRSLPLAPGGLVPGYSPGQESPTARPR
ncbi:MAG: molybdopterin-dependent oxidoreductase [Candidatus Dormibacteraeota bacterium]|nr:molybdopterin-dependent oxidoreductase [Candidatus Dormibacteraeota bacterium]